MSDPTALVVAWIAGLMLGAVFFGGLWWTVRKGVASGNPALWFVFSFVVRMLIVLTGFYWVGGGHGDRILVCLLGFVIARVIAVRLTGKSQTLTHELAEEAGNAS